MKTVTKKELVHRIAEKTGTTKVVAKDVIQKFLDAITDELADGNRLEFREFGVFESRERAERLAQNPRTLEKVAVPSKKIVKFKVGRLMRSCVANGESTAIARKREELASTDKPEEVERLRAELRALGAQGEASGQMTAAPAPGGVIPPAAASAASAVQEQAGEA